MVGINRKASMLVITLVVLCSEFVCLEPLIFGGVTPINVLKANKPIFPVVKIVCPNPSIIMPDGKTCRQFRTGSATTGECPPGWNMHPNNRTCFKSVDRDRNTQKCPEGWSPMPDTRTCRIFTYVQCHKLTCPNGWQLHWDGHTCWQDMKPLVYEVTYPDK